MEMALLLRPVRLVALDVDGTLTDGVLHRDAQSGEAKRFHVQDGLGIVMAQLVGLRVAVVSGRQSAAVEKRMAELHVADLVQGAGDKARVLQELMARHELTPAQVAYVGDDINDLPAFDTVGVRIAVADAVPLLRARADWVTERPGGRGAVREALDAILAAQGRTEEAVAAYLASVRDAAARQ